MKKICLYFQVHQPFRFRKYAFFDIGKEHYYYDDFLNESILYRIAHESYIPTNELLLRLINKHNGAFKITFSISGVALDQMELYTPEVLDSFKKLAATGCVEFLAETYSHSLVSLYNKEAFTKQVKRHHKRIKNLFGLQPKVFRNTELIYSDMIGKDVQEMGYKGILAEGAKHILGWKTPNKLYCNNLEPKLKVLLRNYKLSDDIAFRFSDKNWEDYPLTADKFAKSLSNEGDLGDVINIFMDYETFGEHQKRETGIFDFVENLPDTILRSGMGFCTPSEAVKELDTVAPISMSDPTSWADEERDTSAWLGNEMQKEAFQKLYRLSKKVSKSKDKKIKKDWRYLQTSDIFYYMSTKWLTDGEVHAYFNPYPSPYDAFINYMNILSDFAIRLKDTEKKKK